MLGPKLIKHLTINHLYRRRRHQLSNGLLFAPIADQLWLRSILCKKMITSL